LVSDPVVAARLSALAAVHLDLDTTLFGATRSFAYQTDLNLGQLASGLLGAVVVILAGALWRRARAGAPDRKP
jgi:hypothetical protein